MACARGKCACSGSVPCSARRGAAGACARPGWARHGARSRRESGIGARVRRGRMARGVCEGVGPSELGEEEPGTACSGRRKGRECRARGEGERRGRREEKKEKKKRKKENGREKKKRRERKKREGERFAPDPLRAVGHAQRRSRVRGRVRARVKGEHGDGFGCRGRVFWGSGDRAKQGKLPKN